MLLLTSTSDVLKLTTSAAGDVDVHVSYVDNASGTITPGRNNPASILTATTTTILSAPGSSTQRNVKMLSVLNHHATVTNVVELYHTDGTNENELAVCTLLPAERLIMGEDGQFVHYDSNGAPYQYSQPASPNLGITGTLAETMPRETCPEVNTVAPTASGTLFLQAIYLKAGTLVSNISISSATTAANTPTNYFFALYDANRALKAVSANQTTTAWAANTLKTLAMTTPYRVPTSGLYYIGIMMTATAVITTKGGTAKTGGQLASTVPILHGTSSTGLTTSMPDPAGAITGGLVTIYAAVT